MLIVPLTFIFLTLLYGFLWIATMHQLHESQRNTDKATAVAQEWKSLYDEAAKTRDSNFEGWKASLNRERELRELLNINVVAEP